MLECSQSISGSGQVHAIPWQEARFNGKRPNGKGPNSIDGRRPNDGEHYICKGLLYFYTCISLQMVKVRMRWEEGIKEYTRLAGHSF